jgi:PAS domain S-box-containing protein
MTALPARISRRQRRARAEGEGVPAPDPAARRLDDLARPRSATDAMVAAIGDQLCAIVRDDYDITVSIPDDTDNLHVQKLMLLINALLENVRRTLRSLSELADDLEAKVRERTLRLDLIVQGANDGVWIWDVATGAAEFSTRWRQLLGLEDQALGHIEDWLSRVHPDDVQRLRAALRAHLQGTTQFLHVDYRIRHADGTWRWMWCRGKCNRTEAGRAALVAGTQTDMHALRSIDAVTGLPNEQTLHALIETLIAARIPFRAMVIGIPRVVTMKEDLGTLEIEGLRAAIAERLSGALPLGIDLARLSGDFYAAILPCDRGEGCGGPEVAEALTRAFARPFVAGGRSIWLEVFSGATMPVAGPPATVSDVMRDAWTSYRCARTEGRRLNLLSEPQVAAARDRALMVQEVRAGLEQGWFVPFLQPIVDIRTGVTRGFETLARLDHPAMGLLSPGRFLPVAEEMGVMGEISGQMLVRAVDILADLAARGGPQRELFLSVNLDAARVMEPGFVPEVAALLASRAVAPERLKIEIVESSVIGNFAVAAQQIARLRALGVKIALDDFGTGYSSLEYLNQLEFDLIKIDKAFLDGIEADGRKQSMVRMMCMMSELLGADVCVEGVEQEAQAEIARGLNVAYGQGYLYARPMPLAQALAHSDALPRPAARAGR